MPFVINYSEPKFDDVASLVKYLDDQPEGDKVARPLYRTGYAGDHAQVVMHLGRNAAGVVVAQGVADFTKLSDSSVGLAASTAGNTVVLTAGHTIQESTGTARIWDRTTAAEYGDAPFVRVGDNLVVGAAAAAIVQGRLTAGSIVEMWCIDSCTLCVGGATRTLQPMAGCTLRVIHDTGIRARGNAVVYPRWAPLAANDWSLNLGVSYERSANADNQRAVFGAWVSALQHAGAGLKRFGGVDYLRPSYGALAAPTETNLVNDDGAAALTRMRLRVEYSGGVQYLLTLAYPAERRTILAGALTAAPTGILLRSVAGGGETITATLKDAVCG